MFISRKINEGLSEGMWENYFMQVLPRIRFFKPKDIFWDNLRKIQKANDIMMFIDCGTGNGDLPKEAKESQDIKMAGCDIVKREGNDPCEVQIIPAHRMPCQKNIWLMVCRPDHSGWVRGLLQKALEDGGFIYVGLRSNMARDLGEWMLKPHTKYANMGEENEEMLVFAPGTI